MEVNRRLIESVINKRLNKKDPVSQFATRNKASPKDIFNPWEPYNKINFQSIYKPSIDGVKLKFKYVTLLISGRYKNE